MFHDCNTFRRGRPRSVPAGFAVVADEGRNPAEKSVSSKREVNNAGRVIQEIISSGPD